MTRNRNSVQIVVDLLRATDEGGLNGIKTTPLLNRANLSHPRFITLIENLTGSGLVNKIVYQEKQTFVITPKGKQYLETYARFQDFADSFGLEL